MTRFDSETHLRHWQETGLWPNIHDAIVQMARQELHVRRGAVCDLGGSTGLLAARLASRGYTVVGYEASVEAVELGQRYGTWADGAGNGLVPVRRARLEPRTLITLTSWLRLHGVTAVVARRVLPELYDAGMTPQLLGEALAGEGVRHLVVEGRKSRKGDKHPLSTLDAELAGLTEAGWRVWERAGDVAYLEHGV